jgi:hypothetical protein
VILARLMCQLPETGQRHRPRYATEPLQPARRVRGPGTPGGRPRARRPGPHPERVTPVWQGVRLCGSEGGMAGCLPSRLAAPGTAGGLIGPGGPPAPAPAPVPGRSRRAGAGAGTRPVEHCCRQDHGNAPPAPVRSSRRGCAGLRLPGRRWHPGLEIPRSRRSLRKNRTHVTSRRSWTGPGPGADGSQAAEGRERPHTGMKRAFPLA